MKSKIILNSADRVLFGITIKQETKGCYLSVTDLQNACKRVVALYTPRPFKTFTIPSFSTVSIKIRKLVFMKSLCFRKSFRKK